MTSNNNKLDIFSRNEYIDYFKSIKDADETINYTYDKLDIITKEIKGIFYHEDIIKSMTFLDGLVIQNLQKGENLKRFLVVKIISEIKFNDGAINIICKDKNEGYIIIKINNFKEYYKTDKALFYKELFKTGKFLCIINPNYIEQSKRLFIISIDIPSQLLVFPDGDYSTKYLKSNLRKPNAEEFKEKGNEYMKMNNIPAYLSAENFYKKAIELDKNNVVYISNLAEANLKLGNFEEAKNNAEKAYKLDNNHIKSFYRLYRALIGLKKFKEANELCLTKKNEKIGNLNVSELYEASKRKMDNDNGIFNFLWMIEQEKNNFFIDCEEYRNPKLDISFDDNNGLKVIANNDIKKGELLCVCKATACKSLFGVLIEEKEVSVEKRKKDLTDLFYQISNKPMNGELLVLFKGDNKNKNIEQRQEIFNKITPKEIGEIISYNSIELKRNFYLKLQQPVAFGLWIFPSFFNHSCLPNCLVYGIGDCAIIIAQKEIVKNEEVNISYSAFFGNYEYRKKIINNVFHFECHCDLCEKDRKNYNDTIKIKFNGYYDFLLGEYEKVVDFYEQNKLNIHKDNNIENLGPNAKEFIENFDNKIENEFEKFNKYIDDCKNNNNIYEYSFYDIANLLYIMGKIKKVYKPKEAITYLKKSYENIKNKQFDFENEILANLIECYKNTGDDYKEINQLFDEQILLMYSNDENIKNQLNKEKF